MTIGCKEKPFPYLSRIHTVPLLLISRLPTPLVENVCTLLWLVGSGRDKQHCSCLCFRQIPASWKMWNKCWVFLFKIRSTYPPCTPKNFFNEIYIIILCNVSRWVCRRLWDSCVTHVWWWKWTFSRARSTACNDFGFGLHNQRNLESPFKSVLSNN